MLSLLEWLFGNLEQENIPDPERERLKAVQYALLGPHGDNATLYSQTAALVSAANFPEPADFAKQLLCQFLDCCDEKHIPLPHFQITFKCSALAQ